jgi:tRNA (guanine-N7-)-methyltransferase
MSSASSTPPTPPRLQVPENTPAEEATLQDALAPGARPIRSFVLRQGRLSAAQARALEEQRNFVIDYGSTLLDPAKTFRRQAPLVVEIGFGMGHATADIAEALPDHDFIGVEVHTPGVGSLLKMLGARSIQNIRVIQHDAVEVLRDMIADESLAGVHIFFPDPWPKKRHHKRRLIQPGFVASLVRKLKPGGYIHCATDWQEYAAHMLHVLQNEPALKNTASGYAPRPAYRTESNFERRGLRLGHGVWDLVFRRQ